MLVQLEKEAEEDKESYDGMVCWCTTNDKDKVTAIDDAEARLSDLETSIKELTALSSRLQTELENLEKEIAENKKALEEATEQRKKEAKEFTTEESDSLATIDSLAGAIKAIAKNHELLQTSSKSQLAHAAALSSIKKVIEKSPAHLQGVLTGSQREKLLALIQQSPEDAALLQDGQPANAGSYAPASGEILGILKQMKETFETNLAASQKDELKGQEDYANLKATKEEQLAASKAKLEEMLQEQADNKKALFDCKEDLEMTRTQRTEDVEFLRNLKVTCGDLDHQWEQRSKMRTEEIKAVSETIAIVTDDDARDLMSKTVTLIQTASQTTTAERMMRMSAAAVLRRAMQQPEFDDLLDAWRGRTAPVGDQPRAQLAMLTMSVQLDAFTKVKEAMDAMVAELKDQQKEEVKLKEFCTVEFNENEQQTYTKTEEKNDLEQKIDGLVSDIERLTKEIKEAGDTIAETQKAVKKASEDREKENAEFQTTVADQRATQVILKKALKRMKDFYGFLQKKALLQQGQTPPGGGFKPMKKNAGASPVIGMIEQIIEESVAVEKEAMEGEKSAQADYETFVKDSNALIKELSTAITEKTKTKSDAEAEKVSSETEKKAVEEELISLSEYKADLHEQCDFILKNFDIRQKARLQEMEAIAEAKGILSGAK